MSTVLGGQPFKVASYEHRPQLVLVGNVELIATWVIPLVISQAARRRWVWASTDALASAGAVTQIYT